MKNKYQNDLELEGAKFKNFIDLNDQEIEMVLKWRNDDRISSLMLNKKKISNKDHFSFIEKLKSSNEKSYWLVNINGSLVGVVDFYNIKPTSTYWGYYVKPELIGKSFGVVLEYLVLELAFRTFGLKELWCETLAVNKSVIKLHQTFGYKTVRADSEIIVMRAANHEWNGTYLLQLQPFLKMVKDKLL